MTDPGIHDILSGNVRKAIAALTLRDRGLLSMASEFDFSTVIIESGIAGEIEENRYIRSIIDDTNVAAELADMSLEATEPGVILTDAPFSAILEIVKNSETRHVGKLTIPATFIEAFKTGRRSGPSIFHVLDRIFVSKRSVTIGAPHQVAMACLARMQHTNEQDPITAFINMTRAAIMQDTFKPSSNFLLFQSYVLIVASAETNDGDFVSIDVFGVILRTGERLLEGMQYQIIDKETPTISRKFIQPTRVLPLNSVTIISPSGQPWQFLLPDTEQLYQRLNAMAWKALNVAVV